MSGRIRGVALAGVVPAAKAMIAVRADVDPAARVGVLSLARSCLPVCRIA